MGSSLRFIGPEHGRITAWSRSTCHTADHWLWAATWSWWSCMIETAGPLARRTWREKSHEPSFHLSLMGRTKFLRHHRVTRASPLQIAKSGLVLTKEDKRPRCKHMSCNSRYAGHTPSHMQVYPNQTPQRGRSRRVHFGFHSSSSSGLVGVSGVPTRPRPSYPINLALF